MNELLITIAIPTYNNAKTIEKTITSCLHQKTTVSYEILIINNASKDDTQKVLEQYNDPMVRIVHNKETVSMYDNHNLCLHHATGKYVLFCHSDDTLEKHAIETIARKLEARNYPERYVLWGHSMFRDFAGNIKNCGFSMNELIVGEHASSIFMYSGLTPSGTCYSRESFMSLDGFLPVAHRLAPSDMTSMLFLAINSFRFEMMDEMIFRRTFASTLTTGTTREDILTSLDDAFKDFFLMISANQLENLVNTSTRLEHSPYGFYYVIAQDKEFKKRLLQLVVKKLLRRPWLLRNKMVQKLMMRLINT